MRVRYAAFLRAINVGGKRRVPMRELLELLAGQGCEDARAYLQSGNVVFTSAGAAKTVESRIETAIAERFGFAVPVTLRTRAEMEAVVRGNPHVLEGRPLDRIYVAFLKAKPVAGGMAALRAKAAPEDALYCEGRDLYLHLPGGIADTKLTNAFLDAKLGTVSTLRNWNTVLAVAEMMSA